MGCDIHMYKEKQVEGQWLTADRWEGFDYGDDEKGEDVPWKDRFTGRNYELFGTLARGVRRTQSIDFALRGIPFDSCAQVVARFEEWGCDAHSHSYLYLHELKDLSVFLSTQTVKIDGMKDHDELAALVKSVQSGSPKWDLLYPYCQYTNSAKYVKFSIDVPASFIVGDDLQMIIKSFDGIDGDNHRIVFWFDN